MLSQVPVERHDHRTHEITTLTQSPKIYRFSLAASSFVICIFLKSSGGLSPLKGTSYTDARKLELENDRFPNRNHLYHAALHIEAWCCHPPLARHEVLVTPVVRLNVHLFNSLPSPKPFGIQSISCKLLIPEVTIHMKL